ncbi:hypothetical protein LXL04_039265 [Taraxacum kok-saghyz]
MPLFAFEVLIFEVSTSDFLSRLHLPILLHQYRCHSICKKESFQSFNSAFSLWYNRPPFSVLQIFKASNCESRHPPSVPASLLPLVRYFFIASGDWNNLETIMKIEALSSVFLLAIGIGPGCNLWTKRHEPRCVGVGCYGITPTPTAKKNPFIIGHASICV